MIFTNVGSWSYLQCKQRGKVGLTRLTPVSFDVNNAGNTNKSIVNTWNRCSSRGQLSGPAWCPGL